MLQGSLDHGIWISVALAVICLYWLGRIFVCIMKYILQVVIGLLVFIGLVVLLCILGIPLMVFS